MNNSVKLLQNHLRSGLTLVDAGSRGGTVFPAKLAPYSTVHAFDPLTDHQEKNIYTPFHAYTIHRAALASAPGTVEFNVMHHLPMSSILEPDFENYDRHFGWMPGYKKWIQNINIREKVNIPALSLDSLSKPFQISRIDYLKLDTQGTELDILKGCEQLFSAKAITVILCETSFIPVYKKQCHFSDIDFFLRSKNFILIDCRLDYRFLNAEKKSAKSKNLTDPTRFSSGCDALYILNPEELSAPHAIAGGLILAGMRYRRLSFEFLHRYGHMPENTALQLIQFLSNRSSREKTRQLAEDWIPPAIFNFLKRLFK